MKYVFFSAFAAMTVLSVVAWAWQPRQSDDRIELTWCSDDNPMRRDQIALFNALYPKYHLRLDPQNAGMEKVIVQSLAGVGPDLFDCYNGFQLNAYVRAGVARDCTEELADRGIGPEDVWPALHTHIMHDGRLYGYPGNANARAIWYNKVIFDRMGVPYPEDDWTWDDFIETGRRLTVRNQRGDITQFALIGYWDWKIAMFQFGAQFYTPKGTRCTLDSPEAARAMQFMQDLIYRYELMPTPLQETAMASAGGWGSGTIALFGAERSAMALGGRWWLCILRDESYSNLKLGAVQLPGLRLPDGTISRRIWGGGRSTLVNATGKNLEGALCFLEYLHSKYWNDLINEQADALAPVIKYSYAEEFLLNPEYPEEDYNAVWRAAMENADPEQVSPYVNGQTVERILWAQADLVKSNHKFGADAMRDATKKINEAIVDTLKRDPVLRDRYMRDLAAGALPAWDNEEDAP